MTNTTNDTIQEPIAQALALFYTAEDRAEFITELIASIRRSRDIFVPSASRWSETHRRAWTVVLNAVTAACERIDGNPVTQERADTERSRPRGPSPVETLRRMAERASRERDEAIARAVEAEARERKLLGLIASVQIATWEEMNEAEGRERSEVLEDVLGLLEDVDLSGASLD